MEINETMRTVMLTEKEKAGALKVIQKMRQLYRQGDGWIKGEIEEKGKDGKPQFCLIGASRESEDYRMIEIAEVAIAKAIRKGKPFDVTAHRSSNHESSLEYDEDILIEFNDAKHRRFKDIDEKLTKAEEILQMGSITY